MKRFGLFVMILYILAPFISHSQDNTPVYARNVSDVNEPYSDAWIINLSEEPAGDEAVDNAPECDIAGAMSCYDDDRLRVDIILNHPISWELDTWYGVEFWYSNMTEYYIYFPTTEEFILLVMDEYDNIVDDYQLTNDLSGDFATVTSYDGVEDKSVVIIIDKDKHMTGTKGELYYLETSVASGFFDMEGEFQIADETIYVDLYFVK